VFCFIILFCRITFLTGGYGGLLTLGLLYDKEAYLSLTSSVEEGIIEEGHANLI
jgi:hypothetical protein